MFRLLELTQASWETECGRHVEAYFSVQKMTHGWGLVYNGSSIVASSPLPLHFLAAAWCVDDTSGIVQLYTAHAIEHPSNDVTVHVSYLSTPDSFITLASVSASGAAPATLSAALIDGPLLVLHSNAPAVPPRIWALSASATDVPLFATSARQHDLFFGPTCSMFSVPLPALSQHSTLPGPGLTRAIMCVSTDGADVALQCIAADPRSAAADWVVAAPAPSLPHNVSTAPPCAAPASVLPASGAAPVATGAHFTISALSVAVTASLPMPPSDSSAAAAAIPAASAVLAVSWPAYFGTAFTIFSTALQAFLRERNLGADELGCGDARDASAAARGESDSRLRAAVAAYVRVELTPWFIALVGSVAVPALAQVVSAVSPTAPGLDAAPSALLVSVCAPVVALPFTAPPKFSTITAAADAPTSPFDADAWHTLTHSLLSRALASPEAAAAAWSAPKAAPVRTQTLAALGPGVSVHAIALSHTVGAGGRVSARARWCAFVSAPSIEPTADTEELMVATFLIAGDAPPVGYGGYLGDCELLEGDPEDLAPALVCGTGGTADGAEPLGAKASQRTEGHGPGRRMLFPLPPIPASALTHDHRAAASASALFGTAARVPQLLKQDSRRLLQQLAARAGFRHPSAQVANGSDAVLVGLDSADILYAFDAYMKRCQKSD